jgi:phage tail protein X
MMGGYYYVTKQGDMWDYIAWKVYGDERQFELLLTCEENRELLDIYIFSAGTRVWCPEVSDNTSLLSVAPWRDSQ